MASERLIVLDDPNVDREYQEKKLKKGEKLMEVYRLPGYYLDDNDRPTVTVLRSYLVQREVKGKLTYGLYGYGTAYRYGTGGRFNTTHPDGLGVNARAVAFTLGGLLSKLAQGKAKEVEVAKIQINRLGDRLAELKERQALLTELAGEVLDKQAAETGDYGVK